MLLKINELIIKKKHIRKKINNVNKEKWQKNTIRLFKNSYHNDLRVVFTTKKFEGELVDVNEDKIGVVSSYDGEWIAKKQ